MWQNFTRQRNYKSSNLIVKIQLSVHSLVYMFVGLVNWEVALYNVE